MVKKVSAYTHSDREDPTSYEEKRVTIIFHGLVSYTFDLWKTKK